MKILFYTILIFISLIILYGIIPTYVYKIKHKIEKKNITSNGKNIYLTFDDGPDPKYTLELLDILKENDIKASFFVVGEFAKNNPNIIKRMQEEGHKIGLHWYEHKSALIQHPLKTKTNFQKGINTLNNLGVKDPSFRPPWGQFNWVMIYLMKSYNLKPFLWDVMAEDWQKNTTSEIIKNKLEKRVKNNDIICLHDGRGRDDAPRRTIEALKEILPKWKNEGYIFKTTGE